MGMEPPFLVTPVAMVAFLPRLGTVLVFSTGQFGGVKFKNKLPLFLKVSLALVPQTS